MLARVRLGKHSSSTLNNKRLLWSINFEITGVLLGAKLFVSFWGFVDIWGEFWCPAHVCGGVLGKSDSGYLKVFFVVN